MVFSFAKGVLRVLLIARETLVIKSFGIVPSAMVKLTHETGQNLDNSLLPTAIRHKLAQRELEK